MPNAQRLFAVGGIVREGQESGRFRKGVEVLGGLTAGKVYIGCRPDHEITTPHSETYLFDGPHPAGNPGVQIEKIRPVNKGETVWAMGADTVCKIGHLFNNNTLDFGCRVAVGGSCVAQARFIKATEGESQKKLGEVTTEIERAGKRTEYIQKRLDKVTTDDEGIAAELSEGEL